MSERFVTLGDGKRVGLGAYVRAAKLAKARPATTFRRCFLDRWPETGERIFRQFLDGMAQRINAAVPYSQRGWR